jgi:hypothetical protein
VRHNGFTAVIPLIAWLSPWPRAARSIWTRRAVGVAIGCAVWTSAALANRALHPKPAINLEIGLFPEDIAGTLCYAPELDDDAVRTLLADTPPVPVADLQRHACTLADPFVYWEDLIRGPTRLIDEPLSLAQRAATRATFWRLVRNYPGAYVVSRLDRTRAMIGLTDAPWQPIYTAGHERHMLTGIGQTPPARNPVQRWIARRLLAVDDSLLFRPYAYLLISVALLVFARRDPLVIALQLSALGYLALLVFIAPAPDIRYMQWTMIATPVGLALHLFAAWQRRAQGGVALARS